MKKNKRLFAREITDKQKKKKQKYNNYKMVYIIIK